MAEFKIITDSTADLPGEYIEQNHLGMMVLPYIVNEEPYGIDKEMDVKEFYQQMRGGMMPTTSQVNPETAKEYLENYLEECGNVFTAAAEIMEERKDCRIIVVDTLCASLGEGLLVHKAVEMKKAGKSLDETAEWVEKHKLNMVHVFTVDDLFNLHRGGRVSRATAIVGTLASIKPLLHVDDEGHLVAVGKVRGRKKSLNSLVDINDCFFISHGDALEDAEYVRDLVKEKFGISDCMINTIGPTIGAHSGPGTVALFFFGDNR